LEPVSPSRLDHSVADLFARSLWTSIGHAKVSAPPAGRPKRSASLVPPLGGDAVGRSGQRRSSISLSEREGDLAIVLGRGGTQAKVRL
jgi:hypothetical protein